MKKIILTTAALLVITALFAQILFHGKKRRERDRQFSVKDDIVLYDNKPFAKYQAKTYSLDEGQLVEEYNLIMIENNISNKQLIGDLIDYVSDRHPGAEVEVEIDGKNSMFGL